MELKGVLEKYLSDTRVIQLSQKLSSPQSSDNGASITRGHVKGLVGSSDAFVATAVFKQVKNNFLVVMSSYEDAAYFANDLENILEKPVLFFPSSYKKEFDFTLINPAHVLLRAEVLNQIKNSQSPKVIVTFPEALAEKVISQKTLENNTLTLSVGEKLNIDFINEFLSSYDFVRTDFVYEAGQYAVRGGIVDIFSFSHDLPYRVEFFGDKIETIRTFDPEDQLSNAQLKWITIVPNVQSNLLKENNITFLSFIDESTLVWIKDMQFFIDVTTAGTRKAKNLYRGLSTDDKNAHPEWLDPEFSFAETSFLQRQLENFHLIEFGKQYYFTPNLVTSFNVRPQPSFNKDFNLLLDDLQKNYDGGHQNVIFADSAKQIERLYSIFDDLRAKGKNTRTEHDALFSIIQLSIREGFIEDDLNVGCYSDHQIFDRYYKYKLKRGYSGSQAITLRELRDLKPGDFVTHIDHGIGKYAGLEKIEVNGKVQESIRLIYSDNDLLYVNINSLNRISKYTGKEGTAPKLSKLGSDVWDKLKKTTKKKVKDIARDLIHLYALRKSKRGFAFTPDTYLQNELEASFIYEDTPDQIKSTADVKKDMEASYPMDRLICGDVGFGKTEVAIRAAFKAVADNKQVAVLVPTTILASQHYRTFRERLRDFPCTVDYINRFKTSKESHETIAKLKEGKIDILIGTHRIVNKDIQFKDLGLLIIDEEQKFGVGTKEKLKEMRVNVDTLTLTATPIPRTLHFSLMGARDLSIINTPPANRQPVVTELHVFNQKIIKESIEYELERGGQVFFVHNRVKDIFEISDLIRKLVPDARIGIGHGQMEGHELENVMQKFIAHQFDVLVATTIIESGLDISNANTMLINHAHQFGLSDLHQMRGRVGRSNKKAFCYLLSPPLSSITPEARKRLSAIEEFSDIGSGFNIAMRDLDIRGAGNLLGAEQSGFIAEIGFEMYHKILDEAVQELKQDEFQDLFKDEAPKPYITSTTIDTDFELLIPDEYISNVSERFNVYSEISKLENEEQLEKLKKELVDRFGSMPRQVSELLSTVRLQWKAKQIGFEKITIKGGIMKASMVSDQTSDFYESDAFHKIIQFVQSNPNKFKIKETKESLILTMNPVQTIKQAMDLLNQMAHAELVA